MLSNNTTDILKKNHMMIYITVFFYTVIIPYKKFEKKKIEILRVMVV